MRKGIGIFFLILAILVTGCLEMTFTQKIYRNGVSDYNISVQSDSQTVLNGMEKLLERRGIALSNAQLYDRNNGFTYEFENIKHNSVNVTEKTPGDSKISYEREFNFPYNYITVYYNNSLGSRLEDQNISQYQNRYAQQFGEGIQESISVNYDLIVFGEIVETNGQRLGQEEGVRFDLTKDKQYYVTFRDLFVRSWFGGVTGPDACTPEWGCTSWSSCTNFNQTRDCSVQNSCQNYMTSPQEVRSCQNPNFGSIQPTEQFGSPALSVEFDDPGYGTLKLLDDNGEEVGTTYLSKGDTSATIGLDGYSTFWDGGNEYELVLESEGERVLDRSLTYTGPDLNITDVRITSEYDQYWETYRINAMELTVENTGDMPIRPQFSYQIGDTSSSLSYQEQPIPAGETTDLRWTFSGLRKSSGGYELSVTASYDERELDSFSKNVVVGETDTSSTSTGPFTLNIVSPENVAYLPDETAAARYVARDIAQDGWANLRTESELISPSGEVVWSNTVDGDEIYTATGNIVGTRTIPIESQWETGAYTYEVTVTDQKSDIVRSDTLPLSVTSDSSVSPKIVIHSQESQERGTTDTFPVYLYGFTHRGYYNLDIWHRMYNPSGEQVWSNVYDGTSRGESQGTLHDEMEFTATEDSASGEYELEWEIRDNIANETYTATKSMLID